MISFRIAVASCGAICSSSTKRGFQILAGIPIELRSLIAALLKLVSQLLPILDFVLVGKVVRVKAVLLLKIAKPHPKILLLTNNLAHHLVGRVSDAVLQSGHNRIVSRFFVRGGFV